MASFRLRATPLAADATAPKERLMGPFFLPIDVYKTSQLRDGLFGRFRTDTANAAGYIRVREHLRQLHVAQRLARWLAKKKQLARVLMWIVPREGQARFLKHAAGARIGGRGGAGGRTIPGASYDRTRRR